MRVSVTFPLSLIATLMLLSLVTVPLEARAQIVQPVQTNVDEVANLQCKQEVAKRAAMKPPVPPPPTPPFPCEGPHTTGTCMGPICKSESFKAGGGQSGGTSGMDQLMKALGELAGKMMSGGSGGGSPPPPPGTQGSGSDNGGQGCTGNFQTTGDSLLSNPCPQYQTSVSSGISTDLSGCDPLSAALGICPGNTPPSPPTPIPTTPTPTPTPTPTSASTATPTPATPRIIFQPTSEGGIGILGGVRGDIFTRLHDATLVAGTRDEKNNVEVSGFYGSQTFGSQGPQSLVSGWCRSRPWATNFLSKIIDPAFFDGLCKSRGYQVGEPPAPPQEPAPPVTHPKTTTSTPPATTTPSVPPKVDIWAVPASVSLGARTSIFWNTQGVTNCLETSPDGSFNQSSLSGGAATVPITAATTFTISCLVPDGTHATAFVTVNLSI